MALTTSTDDLNIIAALDDEPNDVGGLSAAQLKAKFDEAVLTFQTYFNGTHIPELDADHLPYLYGAATTIKETMEGLVVGVMPDDSVTPAKLADATLTYINESNAWSLIQSYTTAGSYTWTVPDIYGDCEPYEIGVYIVGGGGSGAAVHYVYNYDTWYLAASGGASGRAKCCLMTVTPGDEISCVVGSGGTAVSTTSSLDGVDGGTTSFNGITINGGEGGNKSVSDSISSYAAPAIGGQCSEKSTYSSLDGTAPSMGQGVNATASYFYFLESLNLFNLKRYLGAGGYSTGRSATSDSSHAQTAPELDDENSAGDGLAYYGTTDISKTAGSATGIGNGGGACVVSINAGSGSGETSTSGAGSDGGVLIYAKGVTA